MFHRSKALRVLIILSALILVGAIIFLSFSALSAANTVPMSRLSSTTRTITWTDLIPSACSSIAASLGNIIYCDSHGACPGTQGNDLILGTAGNDNIDGKKGNDCIIGGDGDDKLDGGDGTDVCLGGPGTNTYPNCETFSP